MFRKISMEAVGLSLLILAISLVTATLALAEPNHRAFENVDQQNDEPTAPLNLSLTCQNTTNSESIAATVQLSVTPSGRPVHAYVLSKSFGVCESSTEPEHSMSGVFDSYTFSAGGRHCSTLQGPVSFTVFEIRNYAGLSSRAVALTLGSQSYNCRVRP